MTPYPIDDINAQDLLQSPKHKCKYILLYISLILYPLKFKMFSKRVLVQFHLSSASVLSLLARL
jgi:hypothetical protein